MESCVNQKCAFEKKLSAGNFGAPQVCVCDERRMVFKPIPPMAENKVASITNRHEYDMYVKGNQLCSNPNRAAHSSCMYEDFSDRDGYMAVSAHGDVDLFSWTTTRRFESDKAEVIVPLTLSVIQSWKAIAVNLIEAVFELWDSGITHRDIKPENIMIDNDLNLTLIDFGGACFLQEDEHLCGDAPYGTAEYIPRALDGQTFESRHTTGVMVYKSQAEFHKQLDAYAVLKTLAFIVLPYVDDLHFEECLRARKMYCITNNLSVRTFLDIQRQMDLGDLRYGVYAPLFSRICRQFKDSDPQFSNVFNQIYKFVQSGKFMDNALLLRDIHKELSSVNDDNTDEI